MAANGVGLATLVGNAGAIRATYPGFDDWMFPVLAISALASIAACIALWGWRRWGMIVLVLAYAVMFAVNLLFAAPLMHTLFGPIGLLILAAAGWPLRNRFRPGGGHREPD